MLKAGTVTAAAERPASREPPLLPRDVIEELLGRLVEADRLDLLERLLTGLVQILADADEWRIESGRSGPQCVEESLSPNVASPGAGWTI